LKTQKANSQWATQKKMQALSSNTEFILESHHSIEKSMLYKDIELSVVTQKRKQKELQMQQNEKLLFDITDSIDSKKRSHWINGKNI